MAEISSDPQISGDTGPGETDSGKTGSGGDTDITILPPPDCPLPEPQPPQTSRIDLTDENGTLIGYRLISTGEFDQWIEDFDLHDRRTGWLYTNTDGYQQSGTCTDLFDDSGERIGERWQILSLSPGGYQDEAIEIHDSAGNLLSSTYSNSDGFRSSWLRTPATEDPHPSGFAVAYGVSYEQYSHDELQHSSTEAYSLEGWLLGSVSTNVDGSRTTYTLICLRADDGSISGYEGLWEFTGADGSMTTWSDLYDAMLVPVVTNDTGGGDTSSGDPETGKPSDSGAEQSGDVQGDGGEPPLVEEPCTWLPPEEWVVTTEVEPEPRVIICEPIPLESFVLKTFELEPLALSEPPQPSEPDPSTSADGVETDSSLVDGPVMQITGSPVALSAPPPPAGSTVRSERRNLDLTQRRHDGARHGELTGDRDLKLTGNRFDNVLIGNAGDNRIAGGRGIDQCSGGAGVDGFVLIARRGSHDWLTDFNPEEDHLLLRGQGLRRLFKDGELREGVLGDRLIWDDAEKTLLFDPDGSAGPREPIQLAIIPGLEAQAVTADLFLPG